MAYLLALLMNRVYANVSVVLCYAYHRDLHSFPTRRSSDLTLLDVRVFDEATKRAVYAQQTNQAKAAGTSNCSDRKSTRLNSSHVAISYAVFCLKKKKTYKNTRLHNISIRQFIA